MSKDKITIPELIKKILSKDFLKTIIECYIAGKKNDLEIRKLYREMKEKKRGKTGSGFTE